MTKQTAAPRGEMPEARLTHQRNAFVDRLREQRIVHTPEVEEVLRTVPHHPFVPGELLDAAYTSLLPHPAATRTAAEPALAALLLEQAQVRPGMRVLLIGPTTGYLAALLAHLTGVHSHVTVVNPDPGLAQAAISHLHALGYDGVHVVSSQASLGHTDGALYDLVVATEEIADVPAPWLQQITREGRLVVPLRLRGSLYRIISFARINDHWTAAHHETSAYIPPPSGGVTSDPLRLAALDEASAVTLHLHPDQNVNGSSLFRVLNQKRHEVWTQVPMTAGDSFDLLLLYVACSLAGGLSRMTVREEPIGTSMITPVFPWGTMAVPGEGDLAYITLRGADTTTVASELVRKVGVIGHGPEGSSLAEGVAHYVRLWDREFRDGWVRINLQRADALQRIDGQFVYDGLDTRLVIDWI
ncbi:hypothetical protein ABZ897_55500 [Nonomuraea sp. NPDC046802]|uniref:hypothetical protein n=1 Tax=Nonomuraea sp. NPDC046802 TaxID=3154919 RepID=UPI0033EE8232